jgi:rRNA maturation RNase YbeY
MKARSRPRTGGDPGGWQARAEVAWTVGGPRLLSDAEVGRIAAAALGHGGRGEIRVACVFVSDRELARLHARHLGDPSPTDVMAFDLSGPGGGVDGELYVSVERARAVARRLGRAPERELALYVVHGCLHLCGFDDRTPRARARMRAAEATVLARLGLGPRGSGGDGRRAGAGFSGG